MLKTSLPLIRAGLAVCLVLAAQVGHTQDTAATAVRHSAGIAPDPAQFVDDPSVQIYAAKTDGWRGCFAVHPWIIYKRQGETACTRYDVVGWCAPDVVRRNDAVPDRGRLNRVTCSQGTARSLDRRRV